MQLDPQAIAEFKELCLKECGEELNDQEAVELATRFIKFVKAVYGNNLPKLKTLDTGTKNGDNESVLNPTDRFFDGRH